MTTIQTTRFGPIEVDSSREIRFPQGLVGFADRTRYVLLAADQTDRAASPDRALGTEEDSSDRDTPLFAWFQSVEDPDLAFVVTDPRLFVPTYRVPVVAGKVAPLSMQQPGRSGTRVLVIVNKRGELLTGNLQGPLVIDAASRTGEQRVLNDLRYTTRVPLAEVGGAVAESA